MLRSPPAASDSSISRSAAAVLADVHPCYAPNVHAGPAARMQRRLRAGKAACVQAKPRAYRQSRVRAGKAACVQAKPRACRQSRVRAGKAACVQAKPRERMVTFLLVFTRINDLTTGPIGKIRSAEFVHKPSSYLQIRMEI